MLVVQTPPTSHACMLAGRKRLYFALRHSPLSLLLTYKDCTSAWFNKFVEKGPVFGYYAESRKYILEVDSMYEPEVKVLLTSK